jgi:hypothetical protein
MMFPKRSFRNILVLLCFFFFFSGTFLSGNVLRNYWRDEHETFQDDSLAFVDVPNDNHFFFLKMHPSACTCVWKTCKTNFFLFFVQINSNLYDRWILGSPSDLHGQNSRHARICTCARANMLKFGTFQCTITSMFFTGFAWYLCENCRLKHLIDLWVKMAHLHAHARALEFDWLILKGL